MQSTPTNLTIRVIARDGKFLGDDIGGAAITIRDAFSKQILAEGNTSGGSGPNGTGGAQGVMCVALRRGQPLPTTGASAFNVTLDLEAPRCLLITARGPLGAPGSQNTVTATQWVYPGKHLTEGNGFLLELPGLIVQAVNPPTHLVTTAGTSMTLVANVAMMCGCPIGPKPVGRATICDGLDPAQQPWLPTEFEVAVSIAQVGGPTTLVPLTFDAASHTAGRFTGTWPSIPAGTFQLTFYAYQQRTGNTGITMTTVVAT